MPKKSPQITPTIDAITKLRNLYHLPFGCNTSDLKHVIEAFLLAEDDEDYFKRVQTIK